MVVFYPALSAGNSYTTSVDANPPDHPTDPLRHPQTVPHHPFTSPSTPSPNHTQTNPANHPDKLSGPPFLGPNLSWLREDLRVEMEGSDAG